MTATNTTSDRIALITGASGGIGYAICEMLVARNIRCLMVARNEDRLNEAAARLGPLATPFAAELSEIEQVRRLFHFVTERFGHLDILINNAAVVRTGHFEDRSVEDILDELNINLLSPIIMTRMAVPLLQKSADGRIINIISLGGIMPLPETSIYSAAKFGLRGAMLCLGLDEKRLGIRVSCVLPSATETPMLIREAVDGGNKLQFMGPPQMPEDVVRQVMAHLDRPKLERYPRWSESLSARLAILFPNLLPKLIPLFKNMADRGYAAYMQSLEARGLIRRYEEGWRIVENAPTKPLEQRPDGWVGQQPPG